MSGKSGLKLWVVAGNSGLAGPKPAPRDGESVGLFLRLLRERAGMTMEQAADQVRIRNAYISAIEDDRFEALPGRAYAMGFIRAYAEFLGADVETTARVAADEIGRLPSPALRARKPEVERDSRFAPAAAAAICLALAGYVYWYFDNTRARFENAAETLARVDAPNFVEAAEQSASAPTGPYRPFPDAVAPSNRPTTPAVVKSQPTVVAAGAPLPPSRYEARRVQTVAAPAAPLPPRAELAAALPQPRLAVAAAPPPPQQTQRWSIPAPGPAMASTRPAGLGAPAHAAATDAPPAPAPGEVVLRAVADTWIQIKSVKTGKVLFSRVLREGETLPAPDRHGLKMTVGNAGGLEIRVDGILAPSIGGHGQVVRDLSLDGPALLDRAG